jgi:ubiquinone/menaquinone biosynthesis C-methylase UbiE
MGVGVMHSHDIPEHYRFFLSKERYDWQDPRKILWNAGLSSGMKFLEVACGAGFFTLEAAKIIGQQGWVFALDKDDQALEVCRKRLLEAGFSKFELFQGKAEDFSKSLGADFGLVANALHDFDNPVLALKNIHSSLRPGGLFLNVDWKKKSTPIGPPLTERFDEIQASGLLVQAGFKVRSKGEAGPYHYFILAVA